MPQANATRIISIQFEQFKAFSRLLVSPDRVNILVGPNNSGKSTIVGALRTLANGLRIARTRSPERIEFEMGRKVGYHIPESVLPISLENVHTDYGTTESKVTFNLNNGNKLHLVFPDTGGCVLLPEAPGTYITTAAVFKREFPISLTVVPVLGPVEHREQRRERDTVIAGLSTHRASRHFRSYWHYFSDNFEQFAALVSSTWPGMEIRPPELTNPMTGELSMFCLEDRMTRELYWVGFGFQVWCQLLTHLSHASASTLVVIDEPEVYLHPDIQRQLLGIVRDIGPDIVLATHSTEIMAEADPSEIIVVDKRKQTAERLKDIAGVQRALDAVGSIQNITLTALAKNRRVLFVEGDEDYRLLRRFARRMGMTELGAGLGITALNSGGFGSWQRVTTLAAGIEEALGSTLAISAIYDRDYYCEEELTKVGATLSEHLHFSHVHERKEIENYLLIPAALDRALERAVAERATRLGMPGPALEKALDVLLELTDPLRDDVQAQIIGRKAQYLRNSGKDAATLTREAIGWFSPRWSDFLLRISLVPGKEVLKAFRERVQTRFGVSLTDAKIVDAIHLSELPDDLVRLLKALEEFRKVTIH